jgi:hypothetical protein
LVVHDIYWDDEWQELSRVFKKSKTRVCVENIATVHEASKCVRRFGFSRCIDIEHIQMECLGMFEEEFLGIFKQAHHIHLTSYRVGSELWHTHLHQDPVQSSYFLNLLKQAGYRGMVVSEARVSLQTLDEFRKLKSFFSSWQENQ